MKKALALVLAVLMVGLMGISAFAAIPVIDLTEEIKSTAGTYIKIANGDVFTASTSSGDNTATYYTNGIGGVVYFAMIVGHGTYKNIKVDTTGIVSAKVLDYDPAVYSADDEVWKPIDENITFSIYNNKNGMTVFYDKVTTTVNEGTWNGDAFSVTTEGKPTVTYVKAGTASENVSYNENKTEQTVVTVETVTATSDYMEVKEAAKTLNREEKTTKYEAVCNQDVHIVKVTIDNNFGVDYAIGSFQLKAVGVSDGKTYAGVKNNIVADVAVASKDTVEYYADYHEADAKGEIFPINEETDKNDFGYWGYYEDKVSTNKAFVISTTSFRSVAGKGLTLANKSSHPDIIVEIGEVSTNQTGVNFLNESGKEFKTVNGKPVFDYYYLTFYGKQTIASDFDIIWKPGCTYGELLTQFGLSLNESEQVKLHVNADGKDSVITIDYSKVNLYDEVEIKILREAGTTLGKYILSASKVDANNSGTGTGTGTGSGTESNPNTGAPEMVSTVMALAVISAIAGAAVSIKRK